MNSVDALKVFVNILILAMVYALYQTARWGRAMKKIGRADYWLLAKHRRYIGGVILLPFGMVIGIGFARRFIPELDQWSKLLEIHLSACVLPFVGFFILSLKFNGKKYRRLHKVFTWPCIAAAVLMLITGHLLAARLSGKVFASGWLF